MTDRDQKILRHIGLYRVSLRAIVEHLFFGGASSDDVLRRLLAERRIQSSRLGDGGFSLYRLTVPEARRQSIPAHLSGTKITATVARKHLSIAWFCCMTEPRKFIIQRSALSQLFGRGPGLGLPHCWEEVGGRKLVRRLYTPGPHSGDEDLLRTLAREAEAVIAHEKIAPYVLARLYLFTVLVETDGRAAAIRSQLNKLPAIPVVTEIVVVPGLLTLKSAILRHKTSTPKERPA